MVVEREGALDLQLFHHDFAGTIGEAPFLVGEAVEGIPTFQNVFDAEKMDDGDGIIEKLPAHCYGAREFAARC